MLSGTMPSGKFFNAASVKVFHVYFTTAKCCQCLILLYSIVRSLSILSTYKCGKIMSKYSIHNPSSGTAEFKSSLWRHFVDRVF